MRHYYVLDTSVIIEFFHGNLPNTLEMLKSIDPRTIAIPAVVEAELLFGAMRSSDQAAERRRVARFLSLFDVLPFDSRCADRYAEIRSYLSSHGRMIGSNDLLIAATALTYDATLVTRNEREFMRVPGLSVEVWDEVAIDSASTLCE